MAIKVRINSLSQDSFLFDRLIEHITPEAQPKIYRLVRDNDRDIKTTVSAKNVHTNDILFAGVGMDELEVNGTTYTSYEELSTVLTPILFKKGGGSGSGGAESVFTSDIIVSLPSGESFGQYTNGETIPATGKTAREVILMATTSVQNPTYSGTPSFSLAISPNSTLEIGSVVNVTMTGSYDPKSILGKMIGGVWQPNAVQNPRGGPAVEYFFNSVSNGLTTSKTISHTVVANNSFSGAVQISEGAQPKDSSGADFGSKFPSQLLSDSKSFSGIYPYFYGTIAENETIDNINLNNLTKVVANSVGTISVPYLAVSGRKLVVIIPSTSPPKTKWYVDAVNNGNIGNVGDLFPSIVTKTYNSPNGLWASQDFKVYISTMTSANYNIQFQN